MNAIIFKSESEALFIPFSDSRAAHIKDVLKTASGGVIFAGIVNQSLFKTSILETSQGYKLSEQRTLLKNPASLDITLCVPFTRPQIAKRIMFEAACFGIKRLVFYAACKGEEGYLKSSLYEDCEVLECFINGAQQACSCSVPEFFKAKDLESALKYCANCQSKIAPDLYEATSNFSQLTDPQKSTAIVFGGERGFSDKERDKLRESGFTLASLGARVLRTDSAIISALAIFSNPR